MTNRNEGEGEASLLEDRQALADAMFEHYVKPYADNKTLKKMKAIMHHEMTCGDLSHGHGVIKVTWSPPNTKPLNK